MRKAAMYLFIILHLLVLFWTNNANEDASQMYKDLRKDISWFDFLASSSHDRGSTYQPPSMSKLVGKIKLSDRMLKCNVDEMNSTTCPSSNVHTDFITTWSNNIVSSNFCEKNANSQITCLDSLGNSRVCIFDNVMLNFRKMRVKPRQGVCI